MPNTRCSSLRAAAPRSSACSLSLYFAFRLLCARGSKTWWSTSRRAGQASAKHSAVPRWPRRHAAAQKRSNSPRARAGKPPIACISASDSCGVTPTCTGTSYEASDRFPGVSTAPGWGPMRHTPCQGVGACIRSTRLAKSLRICCGGPEVSHRTYFEGDGLSRSKPHFEPQDVAVEIDYTRFVRR